MLGPYVKGRTLELNSGTNSLCPFFLEYNRPIHLSDSNPSYLQTLRETYTGNRLVRDIHDLDLTAADFQQSHPDMRDVFDTVISLNVSMPDFVKMVGNLKYILPQKGTLAMILPAYTSIYNGLDQNLDDWKRYNRKVIKQILEFNFSILKVRFLNLDMDSAKYFSGKTGLSSLVIVQNN